MKTAVKIIFVLLLVFAFLFTGCDYTKNEIKNRLIVQAIGVDALQNGQVRVTLQTLNTDMAGNPNSGSNLGDVISSVSANGRNIAEAIANVSKSVGKKPLLAQNRLVVFGRAAAQQGLYPYLDYFVRSTENRATVLLAMSDSTAEDLVSAKMGESVLPANSLEEIFDGMRFNTQVIEQELYSFMNRLEDPTSNAFLPIIHTQKSEKKSGEKSEEESNFTLTSVAIFDRDKYSYEIQGNEISALLLLNNMLRGGVFTVENENYSTKTTAQIQTCRVRFRSASVHQAVHFDVRIQMTVDLLENQAETPFSMNQSFVESTRVRLEREITQTAEENLRKSFQEKQADPFYFGRRFALRHPFYYKKNQLEKRWKDVLPSVSYSVCTDVKISHIGNEVKNLSLTRGFCPASDEMQNVAAARFSDRIFQEHPDFSQKIRHEEFVYRLF